MEALLNRYRNITVLLAVLVAQLLLLAYQVRTRQDVRLIRVWAVTGVMPVARVLEYVRANTIGLVKNYAGLLSANEENRRLRKELGAIRMENQFLKSELATADRAQALAAFQRRSPSRTVAARIIGTGTGANSHVVYIDRGSDSEVAKGMAVVTPDGIVGVVIAAFPSGYSMIRLVTAPDFAAGVISAKHRIRGTLKGQGHTICMVDYIQNEDEVTTGEWFYTSGEDRVFPKGIPAGQVKSTRAGRLFRQIDLSPSGLQHGIEEVLVVISGVHQSLPDSVEPGGTIHLMPAPPADHAAETVHSSGRSIPGTDADQALDKYRRLGEAQGTQYGNNPALKAPPVEAAKPPQ